MGLFKLFIKREKIVAASIAKRDPRVVVALLAGGAGTRLKPLTERRAKPATPFAGKYRIIDFALANAVNSKYRKINVLCQYAPDSIDDHINKIYTHQMGTEDYVRVRYPSFITEEQSKYSHTADAVYQNWHKLIYRKGIDPDLIVVLSGDHVYKMDIRQVVGFHTRKKADFTICATRVPVAEASGELGVLVVDRNNRVIGFQEKPEVPQEIPKDKGYCYASMGNYVFSHGVGREIIFADAENPDSKHDFGGDIIPSIIDTHKVVAYPFESNIIEGEVEPNWTDVGTIESFWKASQDICDPTPRINLYNKEHWPIYTGVNDTTAPAKCVTRRFISSGSAIYHDPNLFWYVSLGREVRVEENAALEGVHVFDESVIGKNVQMRNALVDKRNKIPDGIRIGYNMDEDMGRGLTVKPISENDWITVVPQEHPFS